VTPAQVRAFVLFALLAVPAVVQAQQLPDLSLEELMRIDAGRVFGASERMQPVTEAPASVSFVTAEEIARAGYRTLADILRGVRGFYVTDDRNFSFLGARGFGTPGDYNSRILLLVNGHRVNDNVFGQAEIGAEFGMDPAMFERVEIIRGPASAIYGDSAFFAVVNVITRTGASLEGVSIAVEGGNLDTARTQASLGRRFASGLDLALSGTYERSGGVEQLYFPAFDTPDTNHGVAVGLDGERLAQFYSHITFKNLTVTGTYGTRERHVPTASFGSSFNEQRSPELSTDRHALLDGEYARSIGAARLVVRASYDRFSGFGNFPLALEAGAPALVGRTEFLGTRWSTEGRLTRPLPGRHVVTLGAQFIDNVHQDQQLHYSQAEPGLVEFVENGSSAQHAIYAQDEFKAARWLILNAGVRYDHYEDFVRFTPRAAVIVTPSHRQSFKYLYGSAFRAPNAYELNSFYFGVPDLRPESIDTHELVWERYASDRLRTSVSTYWYQADHLITLRPDAATFLGVTYANAGHVRAKGLEFEAQMRISAGVRGLVSYAVQSAKDEDSGEALINSPHHMLKARVSLPGPTIHSSLTIEVQNLSSRTTLAGSILPAATLANVTLIQPAGRFFELVGTVRNLFGEQYADPGSSAHLQDSLPQNGRTFRVGLRWKLSSQ
jgi:iron complex outermembrane receptor protein